MNKNLTVYPLSFACFTTCENFWGFASVSEGENELNKNDKVPDKIPSIWIISSPVSNKSTNVEIIGSPAPTVDSW